MADNLVTQSAAPATPAAATRIATRSVTYSGDTPAHIAPVGIAIIEGVDDAKTATDVSNTKPLPVIEGGDTAVVTGVAATAAVGGTTLKAANIDRRTLLLYNNADKSCYVKFGATPTNADFTVKMAPGEFRAFDRYRGRVDGLWDAAPTGSMQVTEITA